MPHHERARLAHRLGALALLLAAASAPGCAAPNEPPKYATPQGAPGELATLKCDWRYNVVAVDGKEVAQSPVNLFFTNGNTIKVMGGDRKIAISFADGNQYQEWRFAYTFQPGHVYKVGAPGGFTQGVRLTDKNTTTSTVVR
jgi:hypothetical protein